MIRTPLSPRRFILPAVAFLAVCLPPGCGKEAPPEEHEDHAAPVKWEPAEKADLEEWTELLGITQPLPDRIAHVSAAVGGYVMSVLPADKDEAVMEGQEVKKGRVLVRLDDRVLRATRDKLLAGKTEQEQQVIQAKLVVELARIEVERLERLHGTSNGSLPLVTRIEMDKARLALEDTKSKLTVAEKKEDVIKAELKVIDEQLDQYTLRAPISGRLGLVHAAPGKTLSAGATVAEIMNLDEIDVLCFVPARAVERLKLDQPVRMEVGEEDEDATKTKAEMGRLVFVAEQAQVETGTVAVKARFPNRKGKVRGNTLVRVRVLTRTKADCLTVPEEAVLEDQEEPAVLVVTTGMEKDEHGKEEEKTRVHRYEAKLGLRDRVKKRVELLGMREVHEEKKKDVPLTKDTLFVVDGGHGLEDNDLVKLKKEEEHEEHKEGEHKEGEHKEGGHKEGEHKEGEHKEGEKEKK